MMMKFTFNGFITLVLCAATSAASATTLMTKTSSPGYVMQEFALATTCTLDDQGLIIIRNQINGLASKKTSIVQVDVGSLRKSISQAETGAIKKPEAQIADAPSTTYNAYKKLGNGKVKAVFLYEDNGSADVSTYNESSAALTLRNFMDAICK